MGFIVIEGYPPFDAFYMTLITITTVGYSEIHPLSPAGRVFNSVLIFFGVSLLFFAIGVITQTVVQLELGELFGKRRMKRMIDKLENHYIVCGYGRVGKGAAGELQQAGLPFVVVDRNPERVEAAIRAGMLGVAADSTLDQTLLDAGVVRARGLIAALATDADNLFVILSAKTLNPKLNDRRARRRGRGRAETAPGGRGYGLRSLHAGRAPPGAGPHPAARPPVPGLHDARPPGPTSSSSRCAWPRGASSTSMSLKQMQIRRDIGVIVLAIRRAGGEMLFNPPAEAVIHGGDYLVVMGEPENLHKLEQRLAEVQK